MLGMSISTMAMTATTLRPISIVFGVCETVSNFENLNIRSFNVI